MTTLSKNARVAGLLYLSIMPGVHRLSVPSISGHGLDHRLPITAGELAIMLWLLIMSAKPRGLAAASS